MKNFNLNDIERIVGTDKSDWSKIYSDNKFENYLSSLYEENPISTYVSKILAEIKRQNPDTKWLFLNNENLYFLKNESEFKNDFNQILKKDHYHNENEVGSNEEVGFLILLDFIEQHKNTGQQVFDKEDLKNHTLNFLDNIGLVQKESLNHENVFNVYGRKSFKDLFDELLGKKTLYQVQDYNLQDPNLINAVKNVLKEVKVENRHSNESLWEIDGVSIKDEDLAKKIIKAFQENTIKEKNSKLLSGFLSGLVNKIDGYGNSFSFKDLEKFTVEFVEKQDLKLVSQSFLDIYETITNKIKEENELNIDLKQKHAGNALKL